MIQRIQFALYVLLIACASAAAQTHKANFPTSILVARHTFFDFGPPFDFYEVFAIDNTTDGLAVERAIISPAGDACAQPPSVEIQSEKLQVNMATLLRNKNPCDIPEKALHRELNRCKHCLNFSGANVTMHVSCGGRDRQIRMDVLDRDWFDKTPNTPEHTSWTMSILNDLDSALGPGVMDKPTFATSNASQKPAVKASDSAMAQALQNGKFDTLFESKQPLSELFRESLQVRSTPIVELVSSAPVTPISADLPKYPPIARAAHVSGQVTITFDVTPQGHTENLAFTSGPEMLRPSVGAALAGWIFPESTVGHQEQALLKFNLNCAENAHNVPR